MSNDEAIEKYFEWKSENPQKSSRMSEEDREFVEFMEYKRWKAKAATPAGVCSDDDSFDQFMIDKKNRQDTQVKAKAQAQPAVVEQVEDDEDDEDFDSYEEYLVYKTLTNMRTK
jgi:hypothetical protein